MNNRALKFAKVLFVVSLLLSACSSAAASPTSAVPATETSAPTDAATPEPTQAPTEASMQLEVVESYQWQSYYQDGTPASQYIAAIVRYPLDFAVDITGLPTALLFRQRRRKGNAHGRRNGL